MKRLFLLGVLIFLSAITRAQTGSCHLRISLLTCSPGEALYSTFGHTALRVQDSTLGIDHVFNYGTFQFDSDFYIKFIRGKLLYFLSVENFSDFAQQYQWESRSIQEQVLQLSCNEKDQLFTALQTNAKEENRYYRYDFLFDNCTTRARDIVAKNTNAGVLFKNILPQNKPTFRDMIHSYLNIGGQYWSKLGIDILLGAKLDKKVSNEQAMFLPDYLLKGFDKATTGGHSLVKKPSTILEMPSPLNEGSWFRPELIFTLLLIAVAVISFLNKPWSYKFFRVFDFIFFFVLGLTGLLLLFMWFGTNHVVCRNNYNLLWALPTHIIAAAFVHRNKHWNYLYFKIVFWISLILLLGWFILSQQMNNALLSILILIIFRSWKLSKPNAKERAVIPG